MCCIPQRQAFGYLPVSTYVLRAARPGRDLGEGDTSAEASSPSAQVGPGSQCSFFLLFSSLVCASNNNKTICANLDSMLGDGEEMYLLVKKGGSGCHWPKW